MNIATLKGGYEVHMPTSGGKAGKGHNITSTLQVRRNGVILKQVRFTVLDPKSRERARSKVHDFINCQTKSL